MKSSPGSAAEGVKVVANSLIEAVYTTNWFGGFSILHLKLLFRVILVLNSTLHRYFVDEDNGL